MEKKAFLNEVLRLAVIVVVALGVFVGFSYFGVSFGSLTMKSEKTVTVTGTADSKVKNQIARFSAGVTVTNADKQVAVDKVNEGIESVIKAVKDFGIDASDIQTQSLSVYQRDDSMGVSIRTTSLPVNEEKGKLWVASNTIEVVLRDVDKAGELAGVLTSGGATNVYGPSFSIDNSLKAEDDLTAAAIENARSKAEEIAKASGMRLGKVVSVVEGGSSYYRPVALSAKSSMDAAGELAVEPGTSNLNKSVTVVFELK